MYPKIRSPLVSWLLTIATGGIYLIFWAWRVANELNSAENQTIFKVDAWRKAFVLLLVFAVVGFVFAIRADNPLFFIVTVLCLFGLSIYIQIAIGNYVKSKDIELSTGGTYSNVISIILLWMFANLGIAYMQSSINRIIRYERAR